MIKTKSWVVGSALLLASCISSKHAQPNKLLEQLRVAQSRYSGPFAHSALVGRDMAAKARVFPTISSADTVYLLERVEATGAPLIVAYTWTNKRTTVTKYAYYPTFKSEVFGYQEFHDPLRSVTEKMDSVEIKSKVSALGAPKVFISRLQQAGVTTYRFDDISPLGYLFR